jgi:hypothetical protein
MIDLQLISPPHALDAAYYGGLWIAIPVTCDAESA